MRKVDNEITGIELIRTFKPSIIIDHFLYCFYYQGCIIKVSIYSNVVANERLSYPL